MDLYKLRYFLCVAKHESMTRAAEDLHITQPNLSRAIASLEEELGATLFERSRGKLKLNRRGELLRDSVEKTLKELDDSVQAVRESGREDLSTLTIASNVMNTYANITERILMDNEDLLLSQMICQAEDIPELLRSKKADLGICFNTLADPDLECVVLSDMEVHLVVGRNNSHADKSDVTLEDLRDDYFICNEMGYNRQLTDALCMKAGFVPKKKYVSADYNEVGRMLEEYDVVAFILVNSFSSNELKNGQLTRLIRLDQGRHKETLKLYYNRNASIHPSAERFITDLRGALTPNLRR